MNVAVLTGAGTRAFAAGGDLDELKAVRTEAQALAFAAETRAALDTIRRFPVPVIAMLNGDALGGGAGSRSPAICGSPLRMHGSASCRRG